MKKSQVISGIFGTDGIRAHVGEFPLVPWIVEGLGWAFAQLFFSHSEERPAGRPSHLLVARDTRLSGPALLKLLRQGFERQGFIVKDAGIMPTPAISCLVRAWKADLGCVISASHNPPEFNGIKFFDRGGHKIPQDWERKIESFLSERWQKESLPALRASAAFKHRAETGGLKLGHDKEAYERYCDFAVSQCSAQIDFRKINVIVDCSQGAAFEVLPHILRRMGAEVSVLHAAPNGKNINAGAGALHPQALCAAVRRGRAHIGFALDGDADRLVVVDEKGSCLAGEWVMSSIARDRKRRRLIGSWGLVTTCMSNFALRRHLNDSGIDIFETPVGDRWVLEKLKETGLGFGGENSGHYIWTHLLPSADGVLSAVLLLEMMKRFDKAPSKLFDRFALMPQVNMSVATPALRPPLDQLVGFQNEMGRIKRKLDHQGRVLVRYSGTEPILRILLEGDAPVAQLRTMAESLKAAYLRAVT